LDEGIRVVIDQKNSIIESLNKNNINKHNVHCVTPKLQQGAETIPDTSKSEDSFESRCELGLNACILSDFLWVHWQRFRLFFVIGENQDDVAAIEKRQSVISHHNIANKQNAESPHRRWHSIRVDLRFD